MKNAEIKKFKCDILCNFQTIFWVTFSLQVSPRIIWYPHYSKSQIFVQKFNFDKTTTFSRVFHQNSFWQFFSWNQSCQRLESPKPQHCSEFFTQKIDNFHGKSKLNFWTNNEDFEQCGIKRSQFRIFRIARARARKKVLLLKRHFFCCWEGREVFAEIFQEAESWLGGGGVEVLMHNRCNVYIWEKKSVFHVSMFYTSWNGARISG